jgi:histone demethylase
VCAGVHTCVHNWGCRWHCNSTKSFTTIAKYAQYQAQTFQQALREEQERMKSGVGTKEFQPFAKRACLTESGRIKTLKFGTNVDLSDEKKWPVQLNEIQKLPAFCRLHAACNTLTHLGHPIYGMNTVQLYMKVPGCRTPGHRENNNFCAININIGPGECEWFAIDDMYWGELHRMCRRHGLDFLKGSWWPSLTEIAAASIPIRRFTQKAGDMVWLGPGEYIMTRCVYTRVQV